MIDSVKQFKLILPFLAEFVADIYSGDVSIRQDSNKEIVAVSLKLSIPVFVSDSDYEVLSEDLAPHASLIFFCNSYLDEADLRRFNTLYLYSIEFDIKISKSHCNLMFFLDFTDENILRKAFHALNYELIKDILTNCVLTKGIVSVLDQMTFFRRTLSSELQDAFHDVITSYHPDYYDVLKFYLTSETINLIDEFKSSDEFNLGIGNFSAYP